MRHPTPRRRCGFTLIELLTVIAIIGILAAVLIPTIGRVRESALVSRQTSNLRQIGQALALYLNDHRQVLPKRANNSMTMPAGNGRNDTSWFELVNDYLAPRGARNSIYLHRENPIWISPFADLLNGYSYHFSLQVFTEQAPWSRRIDVVPTPSRTVLVGEMNSDSFAMDPRMAPVTSGAQKTQFRGSLPGERTTLLWADGHVSSHPVAEVTFEAKPEIWRWW